MVVCNGLTKDIQAMVSLHIYKNSTNQFGRKLGFKIVKEIEDHSQSSLKLTRILKVMWCIMSPNLEIITSVNGDLSQAWNVVNFYFQIQFDHKNQDLSTLKRMGILTKVFCTSGPNLMILAWMGEKLPWGQAHDWHTHGHTRTDRCRQRQYPKAKTGLR